MRKSKYNHTGKKSSKKKPSQDSKFSPFNTFIENKVNYGKCGSQSFNK